jgi:hypothetical protein
MRHTMRQMKEADMRQIMRQINKIARKADNQRWAKGPIDRYSDTDSIFRFYRVPIFVSADGVSSFCVPIL